MLKRHLSESSSLRPNSPSLKKPKYACSFQTSWITDKFFDGLVQPSPEEKEHAYCIACKLSVQITAGGKNDLKVHFERNKHKEAVEKRKGHRPINAHFAQIQPVKAEDRTTDAEIKICVLIAKHNMALLSADHLTDLHNVAAPDLNVKCKKTKATQVIKRCLAPTLTKPVIDMCKEGPFSLMIDESNDRKAKKRLVVLVRLFDGHSAKTRFLELPVLKGGTSAKIFFSAGAYTALI